MQPQWMARVIKRVGEPDVPGAEISETRRPNQRILALLPAMLCVNSRSRVCPVAPSLRFIRLGVVVVLFRSLSGEDPAFGYIRDKNE